MRQARDHPHSKRGNCAAAWHRGLLDLFSPDENSASRSDEVDASMMRGNNGIVNKMEFSMWKRTERLSPCSLYQTVERFSCSPNRLNS
jgi:hypothetical protein